MEEEAIKDLKRKVGAALLTIPRVTGVGICNDANGAALAVYMTQQDAAAEKQIRVIVRDAPVRFIESGSFVKGSL